MAAAGSPLAAVSNEWDENARREVRYIPGRCVE
jgi:hypothetical protein